VQSYLNALDLLLNDWNETEKHCEDLVLQGWLHHGRAHGKPEPYSFDNPDLQAYPKLIYSEDNFQTDLKKKECALKRAKNKNEILLAIDALTANQKLIHFGFNSIWETLQQTEDDDLKNAVRERLLKNQNVIDFVQKKIESKQLGILRKIDYYGFYRDLVNKENKQVEAKLSKAVLKLLAESVDDENYAALDYRHTLIYSSIKSKIFNRQALNKMIELESIREAELTSISEVLADLAAMGDSTYGADQYIKLINSEKSNIEVSRNVARSLGSTMEESQKVAIIDAILDSKNIDTKDVKYMAYIISQSEPPLKSADSQFYKIFLYSKNSPIQYHSSAAAGGLALALLEQKTPAKNTDKLLKDIFESDLLDTNQKMDVSKAILRSEKHFMNQRDHLDHLLESPEIIEYRYYELIAEILGDKVPLKNKSPGIQKILSSRSSSRKMDEYRLADVAHLLIRNNPFPNRDNILQDIIERKISKYYLWDIFMTLLQQESKLKDTKKFQKLIIESPKMDTEYLKLLESEIVANQMTNPHSAHALELIRKKLRNEQN
jgi:hypothetical protein